MSRPGLAELGVHLPPLAVTSAGALPPTTALRNARRGHARAVVSDAELADETQRACEYWIAVQERLGVDILVDGALDSRDLVCRFADGLAGFTHGGLVRIYGDRYRRKPIIADPVAWRAPISVDAWRTLQALTTRPLKASVTGPYTLMRWSFDAHYGSRDGACLAIAAAIRQELNALVAAGARIVQLEEPALAEPDAEWRLAAEALRLVTTGIGAYVVAHTGRGADLGSSDPHFELPVDNLALPALEGSNGLPERMHATIDVFTNGADETPTAETLAERLQDAVAVYGTERLWVSSSVQLGHVTADRAEAHIEALVRAAAIARGGPTATPDAPALDDVEAAAVRSDEPAAAPPVQPPTPVDEDPPADQ